MSKITKVVDPAFRSGISDKTNKPWQIMKVIVDDKFEATVFAPAAEGDEGELKYSDQYKNYSFEKMTQAKAERNEIMDKLDEILQLLKGGGTTTTAKAINAPLITNEPDPFENLETPVNVDEIPF